MQKILEPKFFNRKTLEVAKDLLGKYLVRKIGRKVVAEKITEVEAYIGPHDLASHSAKSRTLRTEVMYKQAGTLYVYFVYGVHWMLNVVTEKEEFPAGVLIRGTEHFKGPGIVTRELKIDKKFNGKVFGPKLGLWFEDRSEKNFKIERTGRIGVKYAGPIWSKKKFRFILKESLSKNLAKPD